MLRWNVCLNTAVKTKNNTYNLLIQTENKEKNHQGIYKECSMFYQFYIQYHN